MGSLVVLSLKITGIPQLPEQCAFWKSLHFLYTLCYKDRFSHRLQWYSRFENNQVFAWVHVHLFCAWFATLVWIHHALQFQILCIFTEALGATLMQRSPKIFLADTVFTWQRSTTSCKLGSHFVCNFWCNLRHPFICLCKYINFHIPTLVTFSMSKLHFSSWQRKALIEDSRQPFAFDLFKSICIQEFQIVFRSWDPLISWVREVPNPTGHTSNLWEKFPLYGCNATDRLISWEIHYRLFAKPCHGQFVLLSLQAIWYRSWANSHFSVGNCRLL